jgi:hypothetical protein
MKIAQQFTAGDKDKMRCILSPVGTIDGMIRRLFSIVPTGRMGILLHFCPSDKSLGYYQMPLRGKNFPSVLTCV